VRKLKVNLTAVVIVGLLLNINTPVGAATIKVLPYRHQAIKHNCEPGYRGMAVVNPAGTVLLCTPKSPTGQGWKISSSKSFQSNAKSCQKAKAVTLLNGISYTCLTFSDGLKYIQTALITSESSGSTSPSTSTVAQVSPEPLPSASDSTTQSRAQTKPGSGAGGGLGNGTGGGKAYASSTPTP